MCRIVSISTSIHGTIWISLLHSTSLRRSQFQRKLIISELRGGSRSISHSIILFSNSELKTSSNYGIVKFVSTPLLIQKIQF